MWTEWHQQFTSLGLSLRRLEGMVRTPSAARSYYTDALQHDMLFSRAETIYAGSSEIQRNLISERILGLPRR
jgi:alkylation response protein AidB-like acyl-CoA dehydrogenase